MPGKIISIEGNIGAGKSTLLTLLEQKGLPVFQEDLCEWGYLLNKFYSDPRRWSYTLQTAIMVDAAKKYEQMKRLCERNEFVFVERSIDTCMVFANVAFKNNFVNQNEYNLLKNLFELIKWQPDSRIFLNVDESICLQRVRARGRQCEQHLNEDYLFNVRKSYLEMMKCDFHIEAGSFPSKLLAEKVLEIAKNISSIP